MRLAGAAPQVLTGFGRTAPSAAHVVDVAVDPTAVDPLAELAAAVKELPARGGIARGLGRSYGDPAQNAGGHVIRLAASRDSIELDDAAGTVTAGAGVSIDQLLDVLIPRGWFVPVTPGTRSVTVGGAIASDIHGKNHHVDGSLGAHVTRLRLMLADTSVVDLGPDRRPELFWATVGGMGLTGVIVDATIRLLPIETSRISVATRRLGHLDDVMAEMVEAEAGARYTVAWIDLLASGRHRGRGVLTAGDHAPAERLGPGDDPLAHAPRRRLGVPALVPASGVVNAASATAFNELWYRRAPRRRDGELRSIPAFFHPLDGVDGWNRLYGRAGFVQYQFVVPDGADGVLRAAVHRLSAARLPIVLGVLKRFGPGDPAPLGFPMAGWQLAVDIGARHRSLADVLTDLDRLVVDAGGRHYLAKDALTSAATIARGYPRLDEWRRVRRSVDPHGVWTSDLARRLGLTP